MQSDTMEGNAIDSSEKDRLILAHLFRNEHIETARLVSESVQKGFAIEYGKWKMQTSRKEQPRKAKGALNFLNVCCCNEMRSDEMHEFRHILDISESGTGS